MNARNRTFEGLKACACGYKIGSVKFEFAFIWEKVIFNQAERIFQFLKISLESKLQFNDILFKESIRVVHHRDGRNYL